MLRHGHVKNTTRIVEKRYCSLNFALKLINIRNLRNSKLAKINIRNLRFVNLTNLLHLTSYHFHLQRTVTKLTSVKVLELLLSNISEAIPISKCRGLFSYNSYIRGFHSYKQNWDPVLGRRYLCITEENNEHGEYAVAVENYDEVVGHIPFHLSNIMSMFLKLTGSHMEVEVTGKYVNREVGYGLGIPCKYHVSSQEKAMIWLSKKINLIITEHECVVNRCLDEKKK